MYAREQWRRQGTGSSILLSDALAAVSLAPQVGWLEAAAAALLGGTDGMGAAAARAARRTHESACWPLICHSGTPRALAPPPSNCQRVTVSERAGRSARVEDVTGVEGGHRGEQEGLQKPEVEEEGQVGGGCGLGLGENA